LRRGASQRLTGSSQNDWRRPRMAGCGRCELAWTEAMVKLIAASPQEGNDAVCVQALNHS